MRAHEAPRTRPTRRTSRAALALLTAVSTALLASACAGAEDDGAGVASGTPEGAEASAAVGTADAETGSTAAAHRDTPEAAADAAVEFFAAYDEIVLTGDESHWTDLSSPDCWYCTAMAGFASTFGLSAGVRDAYATDADVTLEELGLGGFDVEVVDAARNDDESVAVDVQLDLLLSELAPASPQMVSPDGTLDVSQLGLGRSAGVQPARVHMTYAGGRWTVADITAVPGGTGPPAVPADAAGAGQAPTPPPEMSHGDVDGAVAALEHYLALEQHAYRTGDVAELEKMSPPECVACGTKIDLALEAVAAGFEIEAGRSRVELVRRVPAEEVVAPEDLDPELDEDVYLLETRVQTTDTTLRTPEGEELFPAGQYSLQATLLDGQDGNWYVVELTEGP